MKKIEINTTEYPEDVRRIQSVLASRDYEASPADCEVLWESYSTSMAASWMMLDDLSDDQIFNKIEGYINN